MLTNMNFLNMGEHSQVHPSIHHTGSLNENPQFHSLTSNLKKSRKKSYEHYFELYFSLAFDMTVLLGGITVVSEQRGEG